jgi:hypothetical protein
VNHTSDGALHDGDSGGRWDAGPRETRGQTAPGTGGSQEERSKRTQGEEIEHKIKKLRDTYG